MTTRHTPEPLYETPYGRKTGKLLTDAMDLYSACRNAGIEDPAAAIKAAREALEEIIREADGGWSNESPVATRARAALALLGKDGE